MISFPEYASLETRFCQPGTSDACGITLAPVLTSNQQRVTNNYLGTVLYKNAPITLKIMSGIQEAIIGGTSPTCAKLRLIITKMMNTKASAKPSAICKPTPPRDFRELRITPIMVSTIMANG